jgi:hypothetical protein
MRTHRVAFELSMVVSSASSSPAGMWNWGNRARSAALMKAGLADVAWLTMYRPLAPGVSAA